MLKEIWGEEVAEAEEGLELLNGSESGDAYGGQNDSG